MFSPPTLLHSSILLFDFKELLRWPQIFSVLLQFFLFLFFMCILCGMFLCIYMHAYMHMSTYTDVCVCVCICIWRPEIDVGNLLSWSSILFPLKAGSLSQNQSSRKWLILLSACSRDFLCRARTQVSSHVHLAFTLALRIQTLSLLFVQKAIQFGAVFLALLRIFYTAYFFLSNLSNSFPFLNPSKISPNKTRRK